MVVGVAANPHEAHQAGRHMDQPHVGTLARMRIDGRAGSADRHAHPGGGPFCVLDWDDDFPPHGSVNSLRSLLGYAGLVRESRPVFDLRVHLTDNVFSLFGLKVAEDTELDKIRQLEMIALAVQAHLVLLSPASIRIVGVADVERR